MNTPSCTASASAVYDSNEVPGPSSFSPGECLPSGSGIVNDESPTVDDAKNEPPRRVIRSWTIRRGLHQCIAMMHHRRVNGPAPHGRVFPVRRQRHPERDVILEYRRELRRLWMYLDAIAVIRPSRVPPGG